MTPSIFIAVTHLLGVGHLTRAAAIGRALAQAGHRVTLASGGMPAPLVDMHGLDFVQLPPVRATLGDFGRLADAAGEPIDDGFRAKRRDALLAAVRAAAPDILVTELYPFGRRILADEHRALLDAVDVLPRRPLVACSVRDILVAPTKTGRAEEAHAILRARFDAILVHADPALVRLDRSWPLPADLARRVHYTGYVDADPPMVASVDETPDILVAGGASEAALPLCRAALGAARLMPERRWHLLVGGSVPEAALRELSDGAPANAEIERARPDFRALLGRARLFVGLAGYNTAVDLLATGTPAVLVPFERGRETEQRQRAECLAAAGLATLVPEADLSAERLAAAVAGAPGRSGDATSAIRRDGTAETVRLLVSLWSVRQAAPAIVRPALPDTLARAIASDLDRVADQGRTVRLWWRDDDATAATPALDRLLALSRQTGVPVAIAAIPALAEPSLAARLGQEDDAIRVLVHGWAHQNHEPSGAKTAEFGPARAPADARADAARALATAWSRFGSRLLPVFVPPWNRIAPALAPLLPELGYAGLSAFGTAGAARPGFVRLDTHLDPVAWRRDRDLVDAETLLAQWQRATKTGTVGLLSHHRATNERVWAFLTEWLGWLTRHPAVRVAPLAKSWPAGANLTAGAAQKVGPMTERMAG